MQVKRSISKSGRVYQELEPRMEWVADEDSYTLLVHVPGFAREQLKVQLRSRNLIISGERKQQDDTWSRFRIQFPVSENCDLNEISAKLEGDILSISELDKTTKKAWEDYKHGVGVFSFFRKLKPSRNFVNAIVFLLGGVVIGIFVSGAIKSWTKA